jgi:hypothetical protein
MTTLPPGRLKLGIDEPTYYIRLSSTIAVLLEVHEHVRLSANRRFYFKAALEGRM